jgi:hypothetical protein
MNLSKINSFNSQEHSGSDQAYQLLAHDRWFSPGTPASSTTTTGSHDIAEILLKVALTHQKLINPRCESSAHFFAIYAVLVIDLYELLCNPTT